MPKRKMPIEYFVAGFDDAVEKLRAGKKVNIPRIEQAMDRCERAVKAALQTLKQLRVEVRRMKKKETKTKRRKA